MARYWSESKGVFVEVTKMNYAHLINAFRKDPDNQVLYDEIRRRMSGAPEPEPLWRAAKYNNTKWALWHRGFVWCYVDPFAIEFTRLEKLAAALNEAQINLED